MQIHIARNGQPMGPFSLEEVKSKLAAGTLSLSDQAWYEGAAGWAPLSTVPGVSGAAGSGAVPSMPAASAPIAPTAPVVPGPVSPSGKTEPLALWSFILSLVGLLCCGPVVAIGGIICGHLALSKFNQQPQLQGRGLAMAGLIIGYLGAVGWLIYIVFMGGLAALQGMAEGMSR